MADGLDVDPLEGLGAGPETSAAPAANDPLSGLASYSLEPSSDRAKDPLSSSFFHTPIYSAQEIAKGAVSTAAIPSQIDSFLGWVGKYLPDSFASASSSAPRYSLLGSLFPDKAATQQSNLPTEQGIASFSNSLGLNSLKPQSATEDLIGGASRGLGGALATMPLAPEGAAMQLGAGLGGGIAGEIAHKIAPDSWWAPVVGGVIGGLSAGAGINYVSHLADLASAKAAVESTAQDVATAAAAKNASTLDRANSLVPNLQTTNDAQDQLKVAMLAHQTAADVATLASKTVHDGSISIAKSNIDDAGAKLSLAMQQAEADKASSLNQLEQAKTGSTSAVEDSKNALADLTPSFALKEKQSEAAKAEAIAAAKANVAPVPDEDINHGLSLIGNKYSSEADPDKVGAIGQAQARAFVTPQSGALAQAESAAWSPVMAKMAEAGPQDISGFTSAVNAAQGRGGELAETLAKIVPNSAGAIGRTLEKFIPDDSTGTSIAAPGPGFADMKELRSALGEARGDPLALKTVGEKNLNSMYGALTGDMTRAADAQGVGDSFLHAVETSKVNRDFVDGTLSKIASGPSPVPGKDVAPGTVVSNLLREGKNTGETLSALRASPAFGPFMDGLAGIQIRRAAESPAEWTSLTPGAKAALVPAAADRAGIETLLSDKGRALGDSAPGIAAANATHMSNLAQIESERLGAIAAHKSFISDQKTQLESARSTHQANLDDIDRESTAAKLEHDIAVGSAKDTISAARNAHAADKTQIKSTLGSDISRERSSAQEVFRNMALDKAAASAESIRQGVALAQAQESARSAQAHLHSFSPSPVQHGINALVGADLGEHLGDISAHILGLSGIPYHASALVGAVGPWAARQVKNFLTSPGKTQSGVVGGIAGKAGGQ